MSNLHGTSFLDNQLCLLVVPLFSVFYVSVLPARFQTVGMDILGRVIPMLLFFTILSDYLAYVVAVLLCVLLASCIRQGWRNSLDRDAITMVRADLMMSTAIAILAVDFPVFPRRFAKTEFHGFSLMDAGVGAFVFSSGLVSSPSKTRSSLLRSALPLLVLGLARFVAMKGSNQAEHVSEYGVHWNFFLTLFCVTVANNVALRVTNAHELVSIIGLLLYEVMLRYGGLKEYILGDTPRSSFFSANREGILSLFGYFAIATTAPFIRHIVKNTRQAVVVGAVCIAVSLALGPPSRRICDLSYVLYSIGNFCLTLAVYMLRAPARRAAPLQESSNAASLLLFLAANLMTGVVNLTVPTLDTDNLPAMVILVIYVVLISLISFPLQGVSRWLRPRGVAGSARAEAAGVVTAATAADKADDALRHRQRDQADDGLSGTAELSKSKVRKATNSPVNRGFIASSTRQAAGTQSIPDRASPGTRHGGANGETQAVSGKFKHDAISSLS